MKLSKVFFYISFFFFLFIHVQSNASWLSTDLAQFKAMDKITSRTSSINIYLDDEVELGTLIIKLKSCQKRPSTMIPESAAYVEIFDLMKNEHLESNLIFSGWMFSSSPALSALEHPVYDVSLISCMYSNTISQSE